MQAVIVIGAATPPGRLARAMRLLASDLAEQAETAVLDLAETPVELCDGRSLPEYDDPSRTAVESLEAADAVCIGAPVYRATYPGVLKNLLDLTPLEALRAKPVGIVAMGSSPHHYLGVDTGLRAVLAWFGALCLPTSVYLTPGSFDKDGSLTPGARAELATLGRTALDLAAHVRGLDLGPPPLAAGRA